MIELELSRLGLSENLRAAVESNPILEIKSTVEFEFDGNSNLVSPFAPLEGATEVHSPSKALLPSTSFLTHSRLRYDHRNASKQSLLGAIIEPPFRASFCQRPGRFLSGYFQHRRGNVANGWPASSPIGCLRNLIKDRMAVLSIPCGSQHY
jgi:hypothetical protein